MPLFFSRAAVQDEIDARSRQIQEIQQQIDQYQQQIEAADSKARTLQNEIARLDAQIKQVQLEIRSLSLSIIQTNTSISQTQIQIADAQNKLDLQKGALAKWIGILYKVDHQNLTEIFFQNNRLSDFFNDVKNIRSVQENIQTALVNIKAIKADLEDKEATLEDKKSELEGLKAFQVAAQRGLDGTKRNRAQILTQTKGEEKRFQQLVSQSQDAITKIQNQIFYLRQNGVTAEEAVKFGQLAALRLDIRPEYLIAILEVESGLGRNVGKGNWQEDLYNCRIRNRKLTQAEAEKSAFFEIINKLGLNADTVKVSAAPGYGCGGALGPGQFLPTTWLGYEDIVAQLTGHRPPNPWNIEDAFMAAAAKLARAGADSKTRAGEIAAAKAYLSGNSKCSSSICNYYSSAVLRKAEDIAQDLKS